LKRGNEAALPNTKELLTYCFDSIRMMVMRYTVHTLLGDFSIRILALVQPETIGRIGDEQ
jgi:aryl carrier-like protein